MARQEVAPTLVAPTDSKGTSSREQLVDATAALLSERSSLDVSLSEIATRSGLNSALIKYYFGNKEGLLLALLERDAATAMAALRHLVALDLPPEQKLRIHIGEVINTFFRYPYLNRLIHFLIEDVETEASGRVRDAFVSPILAAYDAIIDQGVRSGVFRRVDPEMLYHSLVGACEHLFVGSSSATDGNGAPRTTEALKERYIAYITDLFLRGIAA